MTDVKTHNDSKFVHDLEAIQWRPNQIADWSVRVALVSVSGRRVLTDQGGFCL